MSSKLTEQIMLLTRKGLSTRQIAEILNTTMNNVAVLRSKHRKRAGTQVRGYNRCPLCGRPRAFFRRFKMCRLCLRDLARRGEIPGLTKASW